MQNTNLKYPVILTEYNDESGHYYVATSPNIKGLVADGKTIREALYDAQDAILCLLDGEEYPKVQDPYLWKLKKHQGIFWVPLTGKIRRLKDMPYLEELVQLDSEAMVLTKPKTIILSDSFDARDDGFTCYENFIDYLIKDRLPANNNSLDKLAEELKISPSDFIEDLGDGDFYWYYTMKAYGGMKVSDWVHEQGYDCE